MEKAVDWLLLKTWNAELLRKVDGKLLAEGRLPEIYTVTKIKHEIFLLVKWGFIKHFEISVGGPYFLDFRALLMVGRHTVTNRGFVH